MEIPVNDFYPREEGRCFQKYLTYVLHNHCNPLIFDIEIILTEISTELWAELVDEVYHINNNTTNLARRVVWDEFCRFFLKGSKATLKALDKLIELKNQTSFQVNDTLRFMYKKYINEEDKSDFDFAFVPNPEADADDFFKYRSICNRLILYVKNRLQDKVSTQALSYFIEQVNKREYQDSLLDSLKKHRVHSRELDVLIEKLESGQPLHFSFLTIECIQPRDGQVIKTESDEFYLQRAYIKCRCDDAPELYSWKQFAECVDISMSVLSHVNEQLWHKTSYEELIRPVKYLSEQEEYNPYEYILQYPIMSLNYQLKDALVIFSEESPNKLEKRCDRFIEQILLFCLQEQRPVLPDQIIISKKVHDEILSERASCAKFKEIFDVEHDLYSGRYMLKIKTSFQDLHTFEEWCTTKELKHKNLSFISRCKFTFKSKAQLINDIYQTLLVKRLEPVNLGPEIKEFLNSCSKNFLCILYFELHLILELLDLYILYLRQYNFRVFIAYSKHLPYLNTVNLNSELKLELETKLNEISANRYVFEDRDSFLPFQTSSEANEQSLEKLKQYVRSQITYYFTHVPICSLKEHLVNKDIEFNFEHMLKNIHIV